jgi:glucose dehydrogenase
MRRRRPSHRIVQVMNIRKMLLAATVATATACAAAPQDTTWMAYGGNFGGGRYSDLRDIRPDNVANLEVAWTYHTGEASLEAADKGKAVFEATPIVVDGVLFVNTPLTVSLRSTPKPARSAGALIPNSIEQHGSRR